MNAPAPDHTTDRTTASTGSPVDFHIPDIQVGGGTILTSIMGAIAAVLWVRRRLSRDNVEIVKDHTEKSILGEIISERNRAVQAAEEAWHTRAADAQRIGELSSEVKHLTATNTALVDEVESLRKDIKDLREVILNLLPRIINMDLSNTPYTSEQLMQLLRQSTGAVS